VSDSKALKLKSRPRRKKLTVTYLQDMSIWTPGRAQALPTELIYNIVLWVLVNSIHSICMSSGDVDWENHVMNVLCDVSPSFREIALDIVAKAFNFSRGTDEEEERLLATMPQIFGRLRQLGMRLRGGHPLSPSLGMTQLPYMNAYSSYIASVTLRRTASSPLVDFHNFETAFETVLYVLGYSETLCNRVLPVHMTDLIHDKIQDEIQYALAGLGIVRIFRDLNKHAESMIVLLSSREKDGPGPLAAVRSLIHKSLLKFEAVCGGYPCHLAGNTPSQDPRIYKLPGVLPALRKIYSLRFEEDEYNLSERIQKLVDLWIDGCPFLHKVQAPHDTQDSE